MLNEINLMLEPSIVKIQRVLLLNFWFFTCRSDFFQCRFGIFYNRFAWKSRLFGIFNCKSACFLLYGIDLMNISGLICNLQQANLQI
jgi:hypothetical protein